MTTPGGRPELEDRRQIPQAAEDDMLRSSDAGRRTLEKDRMVLSRDLESPLSRTNHQESDEPQLFPGPPAKSRRSLHDWVPDADACGGTSEARQVGKAEWRKSRTFSKRRARNSLAFIAGRVIFSRSAASRYDRPSRSHRRIGILYAGSSRRISSCRRQSNS